MVVYKRIVKFVPVRGKRKARGGSRRKSRSNVSRGKRWSKW